MFFNSIFFLSILLLIAVVWIVWGALSSIEW